MAEHTPTPWECTGGDIWIDTRVQVCCGRAYQECCGDPDIEGGQELVAQTSAINAAFIVKAVNAHDALVNALQKVEPFLSYGDNAEGRLKQLVKDALASIKEAV